MKKRKVRIRKGGCDNATVQKVVDELAAEGGGTVELPGAIFEMSDALHLRSGVHVVGQGSETVLRKVHSVTSAIADYLGYGHYEITLREPDLLRPGMGVLIEDDAAFGFYTTTATLLAREGNAFLIDKMLNHDYDPAKNARVTSVFPLVSGECVRDVGISNVLVDGNNEPVPINGCRGGGVFLLQAHTATVESVEAANFNGDAVGLQQCTDVLIRGCHIHHNTGIGMHPGSGSVRYLLTGNHIHDNGGDGIFYCLRTTHSLCERNEVHDNGGVGISIGERDTDHIIRQNRIRGNAGPGVLFREPRYRGGDRVLLERNRFAGNCCEGGEAEVVIPSGVRDVTVRRNSFVDLRNKAIRIGESAERIHLVGNTVGRRKLARSHLDDPAGRAVLGEREEQLAVGPAAADEGSTGHLGVQLSRRPANFDL